MTTPRRVFLLSPARLDGVRGRRLLAGTGVADCTVRLARGEAVPLCDVYEHISSLYFRGKLAYARAFARPPSQGRARSRASSRGPARTSSPSSSRSSAGWVITPTRGLVEAEHPVTLEALRAFAAENIAVDNDRYREALAGTARRLADSLGEGGEAVLLGSIASDKYLSPLVAALGPRLRFPEAFVGRGDMSRGGLMLRAVEAGRELAYVAARDAERRGSRPPRLTPRR